MTAIILIMLPVGVSTYMYLLTPDFFKPMLEGHVTDMKQVNFQELMQKNSQEQAKRRSKAEIIGLLKQTGEEIALDHAGARDLEHGARVVAKTRWFRQPLRRRIPMWIGYGLARLAIGVFGFGGRF